MIKEWYYKPLESIYPIVLLDSIHFKVNKSAYATIGVNIESTKDVLSICIGATESSKYWLLVLN
mgnify:CR=1 FL=1